ncbi:hypothetical protein OIU76_000008 [Salix suchowensis]|nr:hypothetical protein OIU76_000008 [Salix suchowensis]
MNIFSGYYMNGAFEIFCITLSIFPFSSYFNSSISFASHSSNNFLQQTKEEKRIERREKNPTKLKVCCSFPHFLCLQFLNFNSSIILPAYEHFLRLKHNITP